MSLAGFLIKFTLLSILMIFCASEVQAHSCYRLKNSTNHTVTVTFSYDYKLGPDAAGSPFSLTLLPGAVSTNYCYDDSAFARIKLDSGVFTTNQSIYGVIGSIYGVLPVGDVEITNISSTPSNLKTSASGWNKNPFEVRGAIMTAVLSYGSFGSQELHNINVSVIHVHVTCKDRFKLALVCTPDGAHCALSDDHFGDYSGRGWNIGDHCDLSPEYTNNHNKFPSNDS